MVLNMEHLSYKILRERKLRENGLSKERYGALRESLKGIEGVELVNLDVNLRSPELLKVQMRKADKESLERISRLLRGIRYTISTEESSTNDFRLRKGEYSDLDPKMRELIRTLNLVGFHTVSSCEGHPYFDKNGLKRYSVPYVFFVRFPSDTHDKLKAIINEFNQTSMIKWSVEQWDQRTVLVVRGAPKDAAEMHRIKESIAVLESFVSERRLSSNNGQLLRGINI